jgi:hypothetical protein
MKLINTDFDEEYVRPPDTVVREQLITDFRYSYDAELDGSEPQTVLDLGSGLSPDLGSDMDMENTRDLYALSESEIESVLELSKREYNDEMETYCLEIYEAEKKMRENRFINVKRVIERIMRVDKANIREYEVLLNAFALYEDGYTEHCDVEDEIVYTRIMYIVKSLRIIPGEYEDLKSFIRF